MATPISAPLDARDNQFNFIRLVLAALVLLSHSSALIDGDDRRDPLYRILHNLTLGELAVSGFFLLSGFLIVQSWRRSPNVGEFLRNRVLRIYPGYLAAALVSVLVAGTLGAAHPAHYLAGILPLHLGADLALLRPPGTPPTFGGTYHPGVNGSLWTIQYEFGCYLCVALLGVAGVLRRWTLPAFTLAVAGFWLLPLFGRSLLTFGLVHYGRTAADETYRVLLFCNEHKVFAHLLLCFCAGGCFAVFRRRIRFSGPWALGAVAVLVPCMGSLVWSQVALLTVGAYAFFRGRVLNCRAENPGTGERNLNAETRRTGRDAEKKRGIVRQKVQPSPFCQNRVTAIFRMIERRRKVRAAAPLTI